MDIFNLEDFKALAAVAQPDSISVYLRMHQKGRETRQNQIRFKNALSELKTVLAHSPHDTAKVRQRIDSIGKLQDDGAFWRRQSHGLAFFASSDLSRLFRLPLAFDDLTVVAGRFHLKPVLPLINENMRFYILALSQNNVQLYRCDRLHIDPLTVENMPRDIDDALQYEMPQRQFQFYTGAPVQRGTNRRAAVFHGQGIPANEQNERLTRYCRLIDAAAFEVLRNESAPLILAGVEYLMAIYRDTTGYPNLKDKMIAGNPEHLSPAELHMEGWRIARSDLDAAKEQALDKYGTFKGTGLAEADLKEVVRNAFEGRIDRLIVGEGLHAWGRCEEDGRQVELFSNRDKVPGALDLLDVAACETILKGGEVFSLEPDKMPEKAPAVAVLRY
jgi:hypothetical protein